MRVDSAPEADRARRPARGDNLHRPLPGGVVLLPEPCGAFAEGFTSSVGPVITGPPGPGSSPVIGGSGLCPVEAQVDLDRKLTSELSHSRQDGDGCSDALGCRPVMGDALCLVGEENALGPRPSAAPASRSRPPAVCQGVVSVEVGRSLQLHPRRHQIGHVTNVRSLSGIVELGEPGARFSRGCPAPARCRQARNAPPSVRLRLLGCWRHYVRSVFSDLWHTTSRRQHTTWRKVEDGENNQGAQIGGLMRFEQSTTNAKRAQRRGLGQRCVGLGVATLVLVVSCGGDDDDSESSSSRRTTTTTEQPATTTTQPQASGDGQEAAFTIVEGVVLDATDLTDRLLQDPTLASDEDSAELEQLRELYTDDSPTPPEVAARLDELASHGQEVRPGPSGVFREFMVHGMAAVDATTIRFNFCANQDQETVDESGAVVATFAEITQGSGEARYVDGEWRFYGLHRDDESSIPQEPGDALPGFCQSLYGGEGQA